MAAVRPAADNWFCHECHNSITPLMVPLPTCPVCNGTFVEEIESNSQDDPREFDPMQVPPPGFDFGDGGPLWGQENQGGGGGGGRARIQIVRRGGGSVGGAQAQAQAQARVGIADSPLAAILQALGWNGGAQNQAGDALDPDEMPLFGGNQNPRGGNQRCGAGPSRGPATGIGRAEGGANPIPLRNLASYLGGSFGPPAPPQPHAADHPSNNPFAEGYQHEAPPAQRARSESEGADGAPQPAPGLAAETPLDLLLSLFNVLGGAGGGQIIFGAPGIGGVPGRGNIGDFAFGEAGFQQILNDLMEQAAGRAGPKPATEEIISALPHTKVTQDSELKECAVCKDDLELGEDLLSLECRHSFHASCIEKWLQVSGTCPICRFELVPQNEPLAASASTSTSTTSDNNNNTNALSDRLNRPNHSNLPGTYPTSEEDMDLDDLPPLEDLD